MNASDDLKPETGNLKPEKIFTPILSPGLPFFAPVQGLTEDVGIDANFWFQNVNIV
jgi:hypothetical protein